MTPIRAAIKLIPLPVRSLLKRRLPKQFVRLAVKLVPSLAQPAAKPAAQPTDKRAMVPIHCPVCGTSAKPVGARWNTSCAACGSTEAQRRLALAAFAHIKLHKPRRILVIGSDSALRLICEDMSNVSFVDDPVQVLPEKAYHFDLCIHSRLLETYPSGSESALSSINLLLSPLGSQVFSTDLSAPRWQTAKNAMNGHSLVDWLRRKGRYRASLFEPDASYGASASVIFGCNAAHTTEIVVIIPKAEDVGSK